MKLMRWLDTSESTRFGQIIAEDYGKLGRSIVVRGDDAIKRVQRFSKLTDRVHDFQRKNALNFYQKAKMLSEIKSRLGEQGIDPTEISAFLRTLLLRDIPR